MEFWKWTFHPPLTAWCLAANLIHLSDFIQVKKTIDVICQTVCALINSGLGDWI